MQANRADTRRGFTLIELMIVVAIIGILAAVAIPNFLRYQLMTKTSEAKSNLAAIRIAETSYYAEFRGYVSSDPSPSATGGSQKVPFVHANGPQTGFGLVGWEPEGNVYFNYAAAVSANLNDFLASAAADIDANGVPQLWGIRTADALSNGLGTGKNHNQPAAACNASDLSNTLTVGPCTPTSGKTDF